MAHTNSNENKSHAPLIAIGIILFLGVIVANIIVSKNEISGLNGVIMQIQVLVSAVLVAAAGKTGYKVSVILNVLLALITLFGSVLRTHSIESLPGVISPLITIVTCTIIYVFSKRVVEALEDLRRSHKELMETNRVIREKDEKLIFLAYYDVLTGLPNRQLFVEKVDEMIVGDSNAPFTVVYSNIDDFKKINDAFGHNTGDVILSTYADRLRAFCGEVNFVGKLGGDEFAMILRGQHNEASVVNYIEQLCSTVCAPINVNGNVLQSTMSFGVASYPNDGRNSSELLRSTDIAITNAKTNGNGRTAFFSHQNY